MLWVTEQTVKFHLVEHLPQASAWPTGPRRAGWAQLNGLLDQPPASGKLRNGERTSGRVA